MKNVAVLGALLGVLTVVTWLMHPPRYAEQQCSTGTVEALMTPCHRR